MTLRPAGTRRETATVRSELLDFAKGTLIVLVCVGHAIQFAVHRGDGFWSDPTFKSIYMFHMPLFMAVAGYLSSRSLGRVRPRWKYLRDRAASYLPPIVSWAILFECTLVITDGAPMNGLALAIWHEAVSSFWFLWALLGSIVLASAVVAAGKYRFGVAFLAFAATLVLPERGILPLFKYTFPYFLIGFFLASFDPRRLREPHLALLAAALGAVSYFCFELWSKNTYIYVTGMTLSPDNLGNVALRWLAGLAVSAFAFLVILYIHRATPRRIRKPIQLAGRDSLYIYIMQGYVFFVVERVASRYFARLAESAPALLLGVLVGAAVAWCCWWLARTLAVNRACAYLLFGRRAAGSDPAPQSGIGTMANRPREQQVLESPS